MVVEEQYRTRRAHIRVEGQIQNTISKPTFRKEGSERERLNCFWVQRKS